MTEEKKGNPIVNPTIEFTSRATGKVIFQFKLKEGFCLYRFFSENMTEKDERNMAEVKEKMFEMAREDGIAVLNISKVEQAISNNIDQVKKVGIGTAIITLMDEATGEWGSLETDFGPPKS